MQADSIAISAATPKYPELEMTWVIAAAIVDRIGSDMLSVASHS